MGEVVSLLFRISGDPKYPFSEVSGVLQRVEHGGGEAVYHIVRRSGEVTTVRQSDIVAAKVLPPARGPVSPPRSWRSGGEADHS